VKGGYSRDNWPTAGLLARSFRAPTAPELLSLCVAKEKVTKEKGHPGWRLPGIVPGKSVRRCRAFRPGSCPVEKARPSLASPATRPCRPRLTAAQGPHKSRRASCVPEATAAHRKLAGHLSPLRAEKGWGGVLLLLRAGSALLYPGPLWRGGRVAESPRDGSQGCEPVFRRHRRCRRKAPPPARAPAGQEARRARHRGGLSLWPRKERVTRVPAGARNRFVLCGIAKQKTFNAGTRQ